MRHIVGVVFRDELFADCEQLWLVLDSMCGDGLYLSEDAVGRLSPRGIRYLPTIQQLFKRLLWAKRQMTLENYQHAKRAELLQQLDVVIARTREYAGTTPTYFDPWTFEPREKTR